MGGDCGVEVGLVFMNNLLHQKGEHETCGDAADDT
jgi:hypothetical protein